MLLEIRFHFFLDLKVNELRLMQFRVVVSLGSMREVQSPRYLGLGVHFPRSGEA